jgi:hypothetical protein
VKCGLLCKNKTHLKIKVLKKYSEETKAFGNPKAFV